MVVGSVPGTFGACRFHSGQHCSHFLLWNTCARTQPTVQQSRHEKPFAFVRDLRQFFTFSIPCQNLRNQCSAPVVIPELNFVLRTHNFQNFLIVWAFGEFPRSCKLGHVFPLPLLLQKLAAELSSQESSQWNVDGAVCLALYYCAICRGTADILRVEELRRAEKCWHIFWRVDRVLSTRGMVLFWHFYGFKKRAAFQTIFFYSFGLLEEVCCVYVVWISARLLARRLKFGVNRGPNKNGLRPRTHLNGS